MNQDVSAERIIAIGDIHGCNTALHALLDAIALTDRDILVPLGDYVDRGPDSKGVLDTLIRLKAEYDVRPIFGNHEEMMLTALEGNPPHDWLRYGGVETLDSYGFSGDLGIVPERHVEFLRNCVDYVETDKHIFLHANYIYDVPLDRQDEFQLRWRSLIDEMPGPHMSGKIAVVGHTPDKTGEILDVGFLKCIDTFCYGGQWLTALDVLTGQVWQANDQGELRP
ncbi:MAG: serine/threonine protein phosphatase [Planctomycetales bacterium]|nr:serine/threonine protein phosphatase [Planctomycetales bacterium]